MIIKLLRHDIRLLQEGAGGYFSVFDIQNCNRAVISPAAAGINNPHTILFLMTMLSVGMTKHSRCRTMLTSILDQAGQVAFHAMEMTMGHKETHTANIIA